MRRFIALLVALSCAVAVFPLLDPAGPQAAPAIVAGRVHESFQPEDGKIYVLVIGSDARHGNPDRALADAIHIVGLNTKTMRGGILNFPRDSWVNIPGGGSGKINEALVRGGPKLVARTLERITGIRLDLWVLTGFEGFQGLIKEVGSVPITLHRDVFDQGGSGAQLKEGRQRLTWWEALAFVRTRKAFSKGDVARTTNQGRFLLQMLRLLKSQAGRNPAAIFKWIAATREHTRLNISAEEIFRLAILATRVSRRRVGNVTVPVSLGFVGAASVVFISPRANEIYARFRRSASL